MDRGNQKPGCRGGGLPAVEKTLPPLPWAKPAPPKRRGCGEVYVCVWWGYFWGQRAELQRQTLAPGSQQTLAPPPPPAAQRHPQRKRGTARASGEVRASRPPLRRFAAPGQPPSSLSRAGAWTGQHLPGSVTPTAEETPKTSQPGRQPGDWRGGSEATRGWEAPTPT